MLVMPATLLSLVQLSTNVFSASRISVKVVKAFQSMMKIKQNIYKDAKHALKKSTN